MASPAPIKRCPKTYEDQKALTNRDIAECLPLILEKMTFGPGEIIMDLGCGSGSTGFKYFVPIAEKADSKIYAVDNCSSMVDYAKEHYSHPNVEYVAAEVTSAEFPLKSVKFNKIFSLFVLGWIKDTRKTLKAIYELLESGGEFFAAIGTDTYCFDILKRIQGYEKLRANAEKHIVVPDYHTQGELSVSETLQRMVTDAGFKIKEFKTETKEFQFATPRDCADLYLALDAFARQLPAEQYEEIKECYQSFFAEAAAKQQAAGSPNVEEMPYVMKYDIVTVYAERT